MAEISRTATDMVSKMTPDLRAGAFVFVTTTDPETIATLSVKAVSVFREDEGVSMILPVDLAEQAGFSADQPMHCITLKVYSSLDGVGLTSAVSAALGDHDIPCNMVAAYHHDHVFVPADKSHLAMEVLIALQSRAVLSTAGAPAS